MKVLPISLVSAVLIFTVACSQTNANNPTTPVVQGQDDSAVVVTTGGTCATADQPHFQLTPGHQTGLSGLQPGKYAYVSAEGLYIVESTDQSKMAEAHFTDTANADGTYTTTVDCHSQKGLTSTDHEVAPPNINFDLGLVVNTDGSINRSDMRTLKFSGENDQFSATSQIDHDTVTMSAQDAKNFDGRAISSPNRQMKVWQTDTGIIFVKHFGFRYGKNMNVTEDVVIHLQKAN